jgi:hypothetical protein
MLKSNDLDRNEWIDHDAELQLGRILHDVDKILFEEESSRCPDPLLICQNIDSRAAKDESDEWKDWANFFTIRVHGISASKSGQSEKFENCVKISPDQPDEIIECDANQDNLWTAEALRIALLEGLVDEILSNQDGIKMSLSERNFVGATDISCFGPTSTSTSRKHVSSRYSGSPTGNH